MFKYLLTLGISLLITFLITPFIIKISEDLKFGLAHPSERKIHKTAIPQLGGISIFLGFLCGVFFFLKLDRQMIGIIICGFLILILGILDDVFEFKAKIKLLGQIFISLVLILFSVKINFLTNPFGGMFSLGSLGIIITILWVVGITNAVNLIDGIDGLACGICLIAAATFFFLALNEKNPNENILLMCSGLSGVSLGFLYYNFYPAKIFMGDGGAYFLGFTLASISIIGAFKSAATLSLFAPILVLGIPILDVFLSVTRRTFSGESPFRADKKHLHHKLLDIGLTQRQVVSLIYSTSIFLSIIALILAKR